ncbi:MAG: TlpA family protein disulfide reductase [Actinobacteria bacterium]|nr:MAG: TlpA family protein disulfide reductase [Actinomycetota bacterium]TMK64104.1 MAG: TlpA family protein disulfide reductase [Actinomycetota bacterium]
MKRLLPVALALLAACTSAAGQEPGLREFSKPLPTLQGETLQGGSVSPADYRGAVMVVNFWATWCGPCRREQPGLERLWNEFRDRGVYFLGVNYRDEPTAARAYLSQFAVTYPSIQDQAGALAFDFGFVGLPDTYVVDRSGQIRYWGFGAVDEGALRSLVTKLLSEGS